MTSPSELEPVWGTRISCRKRFIAGYTDDVVLANCCQSCMAGLFRVIEQSPTVLVPLPAATTNSVADIAPAAALPTPALRLTHHARRASHGRACAACLCTNP